MSNERGFTLLEVLVALAILAVALGSIVKVAANHSLNTEHLRNKTYAHWVAMNRITELQVSHEWPTAGKKSGTEMMGYHEWQWQQNISTTPDTRVLRVQVDIFRDRNDDSPITQLTSFIAQPK